MKRYKKVRRNGCSEMTLVMRSHDISHCCCCIKSNYYTAHGGCWPCEHGGPSVSLRLLTPSVLVEVSVHPDPSQAAPRQIQSQRILRYLTRQPRHQTQRLSRTHQRNSRRSPFSQVCTSQLRLTSTLGTNISCSRPRTSQQSLRLLLL